MVVIGTLSWNVNVEGAAEAKKQAAQMNQGMDDTAETAEDSTGSLTELAAAYAGLDHLLEGTTQKQEEQQGSLAKTVLAYAGLKDILTDTTEKQEEQETQSSFLASGLFFLGTMVAKLLMQYTALGGVVTTVTTVLTKLGVAVKFISGLGLGSWALKAGAAFKSGILWAAKSLISIGGTLLTWGSQFVSWLAAGSSGALAFAGAIGAVIGSFAVWVLHVTGIMDHVRSLGEMLSGQLPGWARDGIIMVMGLFSMLGGFINGFVTNLGDGIGPAIKAGLDQAGQHFDIWIEATKRQLGRWANWFSQLGISAWESFSQSWNSMVPGEITVGRVVVGGNTITEGHTIDLPRLEEGGMVAETGLAQVHEGETYIPKDVRKNMGGDGGSGQETKDVTINVGGIEMGDQSLDLSRMSTTDLRNLAEEIAEILGTEVDTLI